MKTLVKKDDLLQQHKIVKTNLIIDSATVAPVVAIAVLSNSLVLLTDIFDYALALSSEIFAMIILRRCLNNETGKYEFGFGKLESLSAIFTSLLMLVGLIWILIEAVGRLSEKETLDPLFTALGIGVQTTGFAINLYLWRMAYKQFKKTLSPIMDAQWRVNRANALGSLGVVVALTLTLVLNNYGWSSYIDPACSILFIGIVGHSFVELIRRSLADLLDHRLEEELQMKIIKRLAENENCFERFYDIKSRRSGSKYLIDIYLGFDPKRLVGETLYSAGRIKEHIETDIAGSEVNIIVCSLEDFWETIPQENFHLLQSLSDEHLEDCLEIARTAFPFDDIEPLKMELIESIHPNTFKKELEELNVSLPRYWVGIENGRAVGFVGVNFHLDDPESIWAGWLAIKPEYYNKMLRVKILLIWKTVFEARHSGRKLFRLKTSNLPSEQAANAIFEHGGLKIYKTEKSDDCEIIYRQAEIEEFYNKNRPLIRRREKK